MSNQKQPTTDPESLLSVVPYAGGYTKASLEAQGYVAETHNRYWLNDAHKRKTESEAAKSLEAAKTPVVERTFVHDQDTRGYEAVKLAATRVHLSQGVMNEAGVVLVPAEVAQVRVPEALATFAEPNE